MRHATGFLKTMVAAAAVLMLAPPAPAGTTGDSVAARVNGEAITSTEVEAVVNNILPQTMHGNMADAKRDEYRTQALDILVDRELQYQDAVARGMKPDRKQVDAKMESLFARFPSKKEFVAAVEKQGLSEAYFRKRAEKMLLAEAIVKKLVTDPASMSDAELKAYYDKNRAKFVKPEGVRLRLISTKDKQKAEAALDRISGGEDFGKVAALVSEDSARILGGDIGFHHRGQLLPEVEEAAFSMKPGELSDVIQGKEAWFIIKMEERTPEQVIAFEDTKDKLRTELEGKRAAELMNRWMAGLRAKAKIEIVGRERTAAPQADKKKGE